MLNKSAEINLIEVIYAVGIYEIAFKNLLIEAVGNVRIGFVLLQSLKYWTQR